MSHASAPASARWYSPGYVLPITATIPWAPLAGRILLCTIFLLSGITKFIDWQGTATYMATKGLRLIPILLPIAAAAEFAGGLAILLGSKSRLAAFLLFLYLIPTTLIFHNFWAQAGAEQTNQMHHFLKNLAIMGGLALMVGLGPGSFSIDGWNRTTSPKRER
jgi:putative oxidoreductase